MGSNVETADTTYMIVRFHQERGKEREVVDTGLTLDEAQKHCSRDDTSGPGWFDGYTKEPS